MNILRPYPPRPPMAARNFARSASGSTITGAAIDAHRLSWRGRLPGGGCVPPVETDHTGPPVVQQSIARGNDLEQLFIAGWQAVCRSVVTVEGLRLPERNQRTAMAGWSHRALVLEADADMQRRSGSSHGDCGRSVTPSRIATSPAVWNTGTWRGDPATPGRVKVFTAVASVTNRGDHPEWSLGVLHRSGGAGFGDRVA